MVALMPVKLLQSISRQCPCRDSQVRQLATYYNDKFPSPTVLVVYGLEQVGKVEVVGHILRYRSLKYAIVRSKECLSQRHLLSKLFAACVNAFGIEEEQAARYDKVDSVNALLGDLKSIFQRPSAEKMVLVLDGIDQQKQAGPTLLPALARLGDQIPGLSVVMISNSSRPLSLHKSGVPYIHFPPYTRSEAIHILTSNPPQLHPDPIPNSSIDINTTNLSKIYTQFAVTVYDSLIASTSSTSIQTFRLTCERLWPRFIWPALAGETPPGSSGQKKSWDFARLLVRNRGLFQTEGENALHDNHRPSTHAKSFANLATIAAATTLPNNSQEDPLIDSTPNTPSKRPTSTTTPQTLVQPKPPSSHTHTHTHTHTPPLLKHFPTLILLSSYLASHTAQKHDILLFSRLSTSSSHISKKIRRLKATPTKRKATPTSTPSKPTTAGPSSTPSKSRNRSLFAASANSGAAKPFTLERLLAILRAVHPTGLPRGSGSGSGRGISDRVYRELGELERLRLVVRAAAGAGGSGTGTGTTAAAADDATEEKWRVNVGREWVVEMGKVWGMSVSEYEIEQDL